MLNQRRAELPVPQEDKEKPAHLCRLRAYRTSTKEDEVYFGAEAGIKSIRAQGPLEQREQRVINN